MYRAAKGAASILVLIWNVTPSYGQMTTATISGVVKDETQAVLPGVSLTVTRVGTGTSRTVVSDSEGRYRVTALDPGTYEVQAELQGFQAVLRREIVLTIGQTAVVDFDLVVGELEQQVTVLAQPSLVQTENTDVGGIVTAQQLRDLPLNGRDFTQLAFLEPGVTRLLSVGTSTSRGFGTPASFAGARPNQSLYLLDGTDINTATSFSLPGSVAGVVLGVDAVQEFQVLTSNFSAEFGRAAGGIVNAVSRSGSNDFSGSAFAFHRNSNLDARNYFDVTKPDFRRNQFGFTFGGPVRQNRAFFFGAYEGFQERLKTTNRENVPNAAARQGLLPDPARSGEFINVGVSPAVAPYLALFPMPNGRDFGNGIAEYVFSGSNPINENYAVVKLDYVLSDSTSFLVRYTRDHGEAERAQRGFVNIARVSENTMRYLTVEQKKVFSQNLLNISRFAYNYSQLADLDRFLTQIDPSLSYVAGMTLGEANVPGLSDVGGDHRMPGLRTQANFQFSNDLTYLRGSHSLKSGFNVQRIHFDRLSTNSDNGWYQFGSFADYLRGRASRVFVNMPGSDPLRQFRQYLVGLYVQDDYTVTDRLTLNVGLRYEFITTPTEVNGKVSSMRDFLRDGNTTVGDPVFKNPSLKNFAPRLGFAWDVSGTGVLAVRGGFGVFHDPILPPVFAIGTTGSPPFSLLVSVANPPFPDFYERALEATENVEIDPRTFSTTNMEWDPKQPYVMKHNLMVERELFGSLVGSIGYLGSRGVNLPMLVDINTVPAMQLADGRFFVPAGGTRRNPNYGPIVANPVFEARSSYDAMLVKVYRRLKDGFQFQTSYTWGKNIDDSTTGLGGSDFVPSGWAPQNTDCLTCERGLSNADVRHSFVANLSYDLPFGSRQSGWRARVLSGWQVSSVLSLSSGNPFSVTLGFNRAPTLSRIIGHQRPDLVPGFSGNPTKGTTAGCPGVAAGQKLGTPELYFDPCAFSLPEPGFFGTLGRNTLVGPGLATLDLGLVKNTRFGPNRSVQLRFEVFNALNRANFNRPSVLHVFDSQGLVSNAGRITSTTTSARQIQLGVKVLF